MAHENMYNLLEKVRSRQPLVHHLTNWVTIYDCAQVVKSLGASPVMAHAPEEVADMVGLASALVLNIGTLTSDFVEAMKTAALAANDRNIPVILDACGAGATRLRDDKCRELLNTTQINIIKGNASEVARVAGKSVQTRGVDALEVQEDLASVARQLSRDRNAIVVITGKDDIITDGTRLFRVSNGHPMMTHVVGTGCMAASVIGTFAAVEPDLCAASTAALSCYGIAAEMAAEGAPGPMLFKQKLFDALYSLNRETCQQRQRVVAQTL